MIDILVIGSHPDDIEIGMGGTILSLAEKGMKIAVLDLTNGEPTPFGSIEERILESKMSAKILGVKLRITLNLPNRYLTDDIKSRKMVAEIIRELRPKILFIPHWEDAHPDHIAASKICLAARFYSKLTKTEMKGEPFFPQRFFYYFCSHLHYIFKPSFIFDISPYFEKKIQLIKVYRTQFSKKRGNLTIIDHVKNYNRNFGLLINQEYAEPFYSQEEIGLKDLNSLII